MWTPLLTADRWVQADKGSAETQEVTMSQITLASPFQSLFNSRLFHRSHVRPVRTRHSEVHLPTRSTANLDGYELIKAQARLFTALR
jgi:hypothetical protein